MDKSKIHMIIGDDIFYQDHKFEMLSYIRNKPMDK